MGKKALITGITGQDGSVLAGLLLEKGYEVHGLRPYLCVHDTCRVDHLEGRITFHYGDLTDCGSLVRVLSRVQPDEIYNLAALSHVGVSFAVPDQTANVNALGTLRLLEAICALGMEREVRFYQASSSEMYGRAPAPQNETTPFQPCSPYGAAKLYAYWMVRQYRDNHKMHASNGILFNHESPVRGEEFVTRKITQAVGRIEAGMQDVLCMGNLNARRDWGHARDYMEGVWRMVQQDRPGDYVLATGQSRSVRDFVSLAFACIGRPLVWTGEGLAETGAEQASGRMVVKIDPDLFRPCDIDVLVGDSSKARKELRWKPLISFEEMVQEMVNTDRIVNQSEQGMPQLYGT